MELEVSHPNPHAQPNPHYRKIELQSPLDLTYLQSNLQTVANQKLDLHLPPAAYRRPAQPATFISLDGPSSHAQAINPQQPGAEEVGQKEVDDDEDPLRARVRHLVDQFLARTWQGAAQNITINGLDAHTLASTTSSSSTITQNQPQPDDNNTTGTVEQPEGEREGIDFSYAPYDGRLQQKVAQLYGEVERLTAEVSRLRREAPAEGARRLEDAMSQRVREEDEAFEAVRREVQGGMEWEGGEMEGVRPGWHDDVKGTYERGVEELGRLTGVRGLDTKGGSRGGGSLTETVGKVQRARQVAMEFD